MRQLTTMQKRDFIGEIVDSEVLEHAIGWIRRNLSPDDVFDDSQLEQWATSNGFENDCGDEESEQ